MSTYTPTIGIEVHAELKTASKMFCGCKNDPHNALPNTLVCPVCLAHPGTLPTVNKEAVRKMVVIGTALGGEVANYSEFDRKNYFYPDIPKAYQLSQYAFPFVSGGELAGVAITRVHLEEDTARSSHDTPGVSLVDFNRAGVPLMELVTEPVIHDAETAGAFVRELQLLLRTLGVSDANMEKGEMRVEANISISKDETLGTKVEVKNLNSFRSMERAIAYEIKRQAAELDSNNAIRQETRGWDETKNRTFSQRSKETADDYRYFPDPDIPKYQLAEIPEWSNSRISEILPKLAPEWRDELSNLGLKPDAIEQLLQAQELLTFYEAVIKLGTLQNEGLVAAANYLTSDIVRILEEEQARLDVQYVAHFGTLMEMVAAGEITSRVAKDLLKVVVLEGVEPRELATEKGLLQQNDSDALGKVVAEIIAREADAVAEFKAGKEAALKYLVGQTMKETRGSANPALVSELFLKALSE